MRLSVADLVLGTSFPLYGLDESFTGVRWVSSWERPRGGDGPATMVALGHGDPEIEVAPNGILEVGVRRRDPLIDIFDTLTSTLAAGLYSPDPRMSFEKWLGLKEEDGLGALPWPTVELTVDGQTASFAFQQLAGHWVGLHTLPDLWLYVHSRGTAPGDIALSRVADRRLYIDGSALRGTDLHSR